MKLIQAKARAAALRRQGIAQAAAPPEHKQAAVTANATSKTNTPKDSPSNYISILGPISLYYYNFSFDGMNKEIMLFGDNHSPLESYQTIPLKPEDSKSKDDNSISPYSENSFGREGPSNAFPFFYFLEEIIKKNIEQNECLDFFMEDDYNIHLKRQGGGSQDNSKFDDEIKLISELGRIYDGLCGPKSKTCPKGLRYHTWDLGLINTLSPQKDPIETIFHIGTNIKMNDIASIQNLYLFIIGEKNDAGKRMSDMVAQQQVEHERDNESPYTIRRKIKKLQNYIKLIGEKVQKQLNNLYRDDLKESIIQYFLNKIENEKPAELTSKGYIRLLLTETYAISRMFRNFTKPDRIVNCNSDNSLKKIIYFGGHAHVLNIVDFFKKVFGKDCDKVSHPMSEDKELVVIKNYLTPQRLEGDGEWVTTTENKPSFPRQWVELPYGTYLGVDIPGSDDDGGAYKRTTKKSKKAKKARRAKKAGRTKKARRAKKAGRTKKARKARKARKTK